MKNIVKLVAVLGIVAISASIVAIPFSSGSQNANERILTMGGSTAPVNEPNTDATLPEVKINVISSEPSLDSFKNINEDAKEIQYEPTK